ncbi:MAG: 4Fe-4S dicluster domain-containing protein [Candidatus Altiarchaeota archaeon]|nr:4Fe-4S dicluster domain-containing protein [Candidatus Altiarchaeota archaeon]
MGSDIEDALGREARNLLKRGDVDSVLGYCMEGGRVVPCFISSAREVDRLVWNNRCKNNLAVYLGELEGRVAVVAKGCDSRAIVELLKAKQVKREDLVILGMPCMGMVDGKGVEYRSCGICLHRNPVSYDIFVGEKVSEKEARDVDELESLSLEERLGFWSKQFNRCIGCLACRNVCPMCFCEDCVLEKKDPEWISRVGDASDLFLLHAIKATHMAGRCVECGECERACPVDIPLMRLYSKVCKDVEELFGVEPGMNLEDKPPLAVFDLERDAMLEENEKNKGV